METNQVEQFIKEKRERDNLRVVLAVAHDLISVAEGRTLTVSTLDGEAVELRLPTVDEFMAMIRKSHEWFAANNTPAPEMPSRDEIARVVAPLRIVDHPPISW